MPVPPVVGQSFKTANGLKATVMQQVTPDNSGRAFFGLVINSSPAFVYTFWQADGTNQTNANFNLASQWPTTDPVRYHAIMPTQDGTWFVTGPVYVQLQQLSDEWKPRGCAWYLQITRNGSSNPTATVNALP